MSETQKRYTSVRIRKKEVVANDNDFLVHYGISGQKWGVRRFQNEDRTLTEEGKKRYNKEKRDEKRAKKKAEKKARKEAREAAMPESIKWKAKEARYLDDAELNRRNNRLQREQQYRQLTASRKSRFMKAFGKNLNKILIASLVGASAAAMGKHYKELLGIGEEFIKDVVHMPADSPINNYLQMRERKWL